MRLHTLIVRLVMSILILVSSTLVTHAAPSPSRQISTAREPAASNLPTNAITITKRATLKEHTIANGWHIQYRLLHYLTPAIPAITQLRLFYWKILVEAEQRMLVGEAADTVMELSVGAFTLSFTAEKGYSNVVPWYIIIEFVEKMLEGMVPVTFNCRIAPPGSVAGIVIKLWVGQSPLPGDAGTP
ncbi:MAG: hypothetical protein Q9211_003063 [Gyalolechia sp. 1 TL-2023]